MFDFDAAVLELDQQGEVARHSYTEALTRAVELEKAFLEWVQRNGAKCDVDRSKFRVDLTAYDSRTMSILSTLDGRFSIEHNDAPGQPLKPDHERIVQGLDARQAQLAIVEWYRKLL